MIRLRPSTHFNYQTAADKFKLIDETSRPVVVGIDQPAKAIIKAISNPSLSSSDLARKLQSYIVQIPDRDFKRLLGSGQIAYEAAHFRGEQFVVLRDERLYSDDVGLVWENE